MFTLSLLLGLYSYAIFFLGLSGHLTKTNILIITVFVCLFSIYKFRYLFQISNFKFQIKSKLLLSLLIAQSLVNFIGVLGPETGFDALWYHLSLPKIWLSEHLIRFIPGAVYKYSVMPKLTETLYAAVLSFNLEILTKFIHFGFGLLILIPLYQLSRKYLNQKYSLLVLVVFYTNLIVGWESTSAYVDLTRTFFETLALLLFVNNKIYKSAIVLGLAVCTKLIALGSLPIFIILILIKYKSLKYVFTYTILCLLIPVPWFIHSFITTGNPIYPFLSPLYPARDFSFAIHDFWTLFTQSPDPISPIYIITAPLLFIKTAYKQGRGDLTIFIYSALALLAWFVTPRTGGGRFILPYLPALTLVSIILINNLKLLFLKKLLIGLAIFLSCFSILYRLAANLKYFPVIFFTQSKSEWLFSHLNYNFGDFIDQGNRISQIVKGEPVLVYGINNMFYLPANFVHYTVSRYTSNYHWVLIRFTDITLPEKYSSWKIVYTNPITKVYLLHP